MTPSISSARARKSFAAALAGTVSIAVLPSRTDHRTLVQDVQDVPRRPQIERRRLDGNQHEIACGDGGSGQSGHSRRPVDQDPVAVLCERADVAMQRRLWQAHYRKPALGCALIPPVKGGPLGVGIDQQNPAAFSQDRGEMDRKRGLADPAFLVQERYDRHGFQGRVCRPAPYE